jgi:hypothetical protein
MVIVDVPCPPGFRGTLAGLKAAKGPSADGGGAVSATEPEKPRLVTKIVDVADPPATNRDKILGEALSEKP